MVVGLFHVVAAVIVAAVIAGAVAHESVLKALHPLSVPLHMPNGLLPPIYHLKYKNGDIILTLTTLNQMILDEFYVHNCQDANSHP